jgi:hypothetical protein
MIEIRKMPHGNPMIISSVSDFCSSMGYCEFRIKHHLEGIKPPDTKVTIEGTKFHEKEEEYEKEHFEFVPISEEELADFNRDVEFAREAIYTRFLTQIEFGNEKVPILIVGQADKVLRNKGQLIVEDSKFPQNRDKYLERFEPYEDQKLQTLLYLNSLFTETGSLDPSEWFAIPHNEKVWIINVKDKNTGESIKIFKGTQTKEAEIFLYEKLSKFALIALGILEPEHHQNVKKCKSCRFGDCEYKLS